MLPIPLTFEPMEAQSVDELPTGEGWQYEPKWDGFRCLAYRDGPRVELQSRNQKPLGRYFPELVAAFGSLPAEALVLDGEIMVAIDGEFSFEALQLRLHPAGGRIRTLAASSPAIFMAFDMLAEAGGRSMAEAPLSQRRAALEALVGASDPSDRLQLSIATTDRASARRWLSEIGHGVDGIVAKRLDEPYRPGERAMRKYKVWKTADCVIAGIYRAPAGKTIDSLLLGLYDEAGILHYVGRIRVTPSIRREIEERVAPLVGGPPAFTGRAPGGPSRWTGRERKPVPVRPDLVVEVKADHITDRYMRHGATLLRWRDDKPARKCTMDQIAR